MHKNLLLIFLIIPTLLKAQNIPAQADSLLTNYFRQGLFSGNVSIIKKGKILFSKSYGYSNAKTRTPNNKETQFRIGSITKTFIAALILRLHERGKLSLNEKVSKYLPNYHYGDSVTIRNLLNHTSGIKSFTSIEKFQKEKMEMTSTSEVMSTFAQMPLLFSPGSNFQYSNSNYLLLAYIAEKITKKNLSQLLRDEITQPLGMKNTGIDSDGRKSDNKALGHEASLLSDHDISPNNNIGLLSGAGAMYSTAEDLLRWERAMYGNTILSDSSKSIMFRPYLKNYGLGWQVSQNNSRLSYAHSGSIDGFKSNIQLFPQTETAIIFLSNYFNTPGPEICAALEAITFNEPFQIPTERRAITLPQEQLTAYIGNYDFQGKLEMSIVIENGRLLSKIKGQPTVSLSPIGDHNFYVPMNGVYIQFKMSTSKNAASLQIMDGKRGLEFIRKE